MEVFRNNEKNLVISADMVWSSHIVDYADVYVDITNNNIYIRFSTIGEEELRKFFKKEKKNVE